MVSLGRIFINPCDRQRSSFQRVTFLSIIPFSLKTLSVTLQGTNAYWPSVFSSWSWNKVNQLQTDSFETTCMQSVMIHGSEVRIESAESHCSAVCSIWKGWVLFYFSLFSSNLSVVVTLTDSFEHFPSCPFFTVTAGNLLAIMEPLIFDILFRVKMMCLVVVKEVDGNGWMQGSKSGLGVEWGTDIKLTDVTLVNI